MTDLLSTSEALRQSVPAALTLTSPEAVADKSSELEDMKDKLKESMNSLSDAIGQGEAQKRAIDDVIEKARSEKRALTLESSLLSTAVQKLSDRKFDLLRQRKAANA